MAEVAAAEASERDPLHTICGDCEDSAEPTWVELHRGALITRPSQMVAA